MNTRYVLDSENEVTSLSTPVYNQLSYWRSLGFPESKLKLIFGIHYDLMNLWDYRVPVSVVGEAIHEVTAYFNDQTIAFRSGMQVSYSSIQSLGHLLLSCQTVADYLNCLVRFQAFASQGFQVLLIDRRDAARLDFLVPSYSAFTHQQVESNIAMIYNMLIDVVPNYREYNLELHLAHANATLENDAGHIIDTPVFSGSERNHIKFDSSMLRLKVNAPSQSVYDSSKLALKKRIKLIANDAFLPALCRNIIVEYMDAGASNLDYLASLLKLNKRVLQLRLTAQNTSFRKLLDESRKIKLDSLNVNLMKKIEVARALGFASASAFEESYKRWMDIT